MSHAKDTCSQQGSENTFEVVIGSREAYRLEPIDKIQSAGLLDYEKMARLTAMHHLGVDFLKGERTCHESNKSFYFLEGGKESNKLSEESSKPNNIIGRSVYGATIEREAVLP